MNTGSLIWMIISAISATVFFLVATIVTIKGFRDLLDLLRSSEPAAHNTAGVERVANRPQSAPPETG